MTSGIEVQPCTSGGSDSELSTDGDTGNRGRMILWPIFGATNQLLAGLSFMVVCFYLIRCNRPVWFLVVPMLFMLILPAWVLTTQIYGEHGWSSTDRHMLALLGIAASALQVWMVVEGVLMYRRANGMAPEPLPLQERDPA